MYATKNIQPYIVFSEDTIGDVIKKINENKQRLAFVVTEHAVLLGSISDGDIRRWLAESGDIDLNVAASKVMNNACKSILVSQEKNNAADFFANGVDCVPVVDNHGHIVSLLFKGRDGLCIGNKEISEDSRSFIIAEIGNNHQGDIVLAKKLVDHAVAAGADCAKFQMRNIKQLYKNDGDSNDASADLGAQYTMDLLSKFQLSNEELFQVFDYCKSKDIIPLCTPWDNDSLQALEDYGMPAYKVSSADFTNYDLLHALAKTGKALICSTGMSTEAEIKSTVSLLNDLGVNYVLLHCNSTYPTPYKDVNLKYLNRLKNITKSLVGYSGHERGICVPLGAVALGACVIEKHLTVDKTFEGTDHKVSLLPNEFKTMVTQIRNLEESLGSQDKPREITQGELLNRENLAKSLVATRDIQIGSVIERSMVTTKSPGQGVQPNRINDLVGKVAQRDISCGGFFFESDIVGAVKKRNDYSFSRPVGVPVRYHDYNEIVSGTNLDFVEFHLSYKDLDIDLSDYFKGEQDIGFAVHSPELFSGDHILDLSANDEEYRSRSIAELSRVVSITRELKKYFPKTEKPVIVVNAGGWDRDGFIESDEKPEKYRRVAESLSYIDLSGVQIAIQTMPPFPWHFGGQSYHNLFVDAEEIKDFCENNRYINICLDISHSMMACNYYGWELLDFVEVVSPYNVHMHIVDAKGTDGEGVEIGKGDVNFAQLQKLLSTVSPNVQFIPEVWQGHKNGGEGFWKALNFLERFF